MVEGARLESVYTGNCIAGSNPALSAKTPENQRFALVFLCLFGNEAGFGERKRHKKTQPTEGGQVFRGFEAPPARDLLSGAIKIPLSLQERIQTHDAVVVFLEIGSSLIGYWVLLRPVPRLRIVLHPQHPVRQARGVCLGRPEPRWP